MGAWGVFIADPVDDSQVSLVINVLDCTHAGMKAEFIGKLDKLVFRKTQVGSVVPIKRLGKRYNGVQIVVGAGKLQHHQHRVFLG